MVSDSHLVVKPVVKNRCSRSGFLMWKNTVCYRGNIRGSMGSSAVGPVNKEKELMVGVGMSSGGEFFLFFWLSLMSTLLDTGEPLRPTIPLFLGVRGMRLKGFLAMQKKSYFKVWARSQAAGWVAYWPAGATSPIPWVTYLWPSGQEVNVSGSPLAYIERNVRIHFLHLGTEPKSLPSHTGFWTLGLFMRILICSKTINELVSC